MGTRRRAFDADRDVIDLGSSQIHTYYPTREDAERGAATMREELGIAAVVKFIPEYGWVVKTRPFAQKQAQRVWRIRVNTSAGEEYQELIFPGEKQAYDFAWEWWESDPEIVRLEMTDSADRADPLILDRRRTLTPMVWANKTASAQWWEETDPGAEYQEWTGEYGEYAITLRGNDDEGWWADLYSGPISSPTHVELGPFWDLDEAKGQVVQRIDSETQKEAVNNPYSPEASPYVSQPPGIPDDMLDGPPHGVAFEEPAEELHQRVFEDREARRKAVGEVLTGDGIFGNWDSLDEALAQARDISPDVGPVVTFFDPATQMFVNVSEYDSHWFEDNPRLQFRKRTEVKVRRESRRRTDPPMGYEDRAAKRRKRAVTISGDEYDDDEWPEGVLGVFDDYGTAWNEGGFMAQHERVTSYIFRDVIHGKFVLVEDGFEDEYFNDPRFVDEGYHMKRRSRIETDPPMGYVNEFFPQMGLLPDNQEFSVPFTDENEDEDEDEPVTARRKTGLDWEWRQRIKRAIAKSQRRRRRRLFPRDARRKMAQDIWEESVETVGEGITVNVSTLVKADFLINVIEGPDFLAASGGKFVWTITNPHGEEVAGGQAQTEFEAKDAALSWVEDQKGLQQLPLVAYLRAITKDILINNPGLGEKAASRLAAEVVATYPQVFGAHEDFVNQLMDEYDLSRDDAENEAQYKYQTDPGQMKEWNVRPETVRTEPVIAYTTSTSNMRRGR